MLIAGDGGTAARRHADQRLLRGLIGLAANPSLSLSIRRNAYRGARLFARYWIQPGYSGRRPSRGLVLPLYGRWCGPGHGGGCPIDELDALCRRHDLEYDHAEILDLLAS